MRFLTYAIIFAITSLSAMSADEVLYWMVDDNAVVHNSDGSTVSMPMIVPEVDDVTLAARVKVVGGNISEDVFLNVYVGNGEVWSSELGIDFEDSGSGHWGVGNPNGMQSPLTGGMAPTFPYVAEDTPEYSFIIEIGNYDWNQDIWTTVAHSQSYTHSELLERAYIHETFDIGPSNLEVWNPRDYYSVPEPNAGILILSGLSFLALKRGNNRRKQH